MSDQRLTQSPEKAKQRNAQCESRPVSAPSYHGGLHPILQLQRTIGNRAVNRLLQSRTLQAKLTVSQLGDVYEQEADRVADQVMRMPEPVVQRTCASCAAGGPPCLKCEDEKKPTVQRKADLPAAPAQQGVPDDFVRDLGPGQPLDSATRAFFEPRFGHDYSRVRVHANGEAATAASAVSARAYTLGHDIVFGSGEYAPTTAQGTRLLAHELTHVVQQAKGGAGSAVQGKIQRALAAPCTPPAGLPCDGTVTGPGHRAGTHLNYDSEVSSLTAAQKKDLKAFADAWKKAGSSDDVVVDGWASTDGPCDFNWHLSCDRAAKVKTELVAQGVTGKITTFAHGPSNEFGSSIGPNRGAIISRTPPPPAPVPPPPPAVLTCALPVRLGSGRGCGSGPDFTHFDFPSISAPSEAKLAAWAAIRNGGLPFRSLVSDGVCMTEMDAVLVGTSRGAGHAAFARFVAGTGGTESLGPGTTLGAMALTSPSFLATVRAVKTIIETQLAGQAAGGALDPCALSASPPPQTHFSLGGPDPLPLQGVIGGTHGENLFATSFAGSIPLRSYTIGLRFLICDNFGVDEHDLYFFGLMPFWVLQHERSASLFAPFINELDLSVTVSGIF